MEEYFTFSQIVRSLDIRNQPTLRRFLEIYGIPWELCVYDSKVQHLFSSTRFNSIFYQFIKENLNVIKEFSDDFYKRKTVEEIAAKFGIDVELVRNTLWTLVDSQSLIDQIELSQYKEFRNNLMYISSYQIYFKIKGKPDELDVPLLKLMLTRVPNTGASPKGVEQKPKVFTDVYDNIIEELEPILESTVISEWGLKKPGGILLYGPPGCGKTYWAKEINKFLKKEFIEVPRSLFGSTFVDGAMKNLKKLLDEVIEKGNILLFFDEFDSIASDRNSIRSDAGEHAKVVNTLLQEIPHLIENQIIVLAATNFMQRLDPAVIRPGRFDLKIPIFPPLPDERIQLLVDFLVRDISPESILMSLLKEVSADKLPFWEKYKQQLNLFSTSAIEDLANIIKRNLKKEYKEKGKVIQLSEMIIETSINTAKSKITQKDIEYYSQFYLETESIELLESFRMRNCQLKEELISISSDLEDAPLPIGFRLPDIS